MVVVVEIVQKNDCVLVEVMMMMMMMMDSFLLFFISRTGRSTYYLDNLLGRGRGRGDGRLQVIFFNGFMSIPGV